MSHIVSTVVRLLGLLAMLSFFAGPLHADPVTMFPPPLGGPPNVTFALGGTGAIGINNLMSFDVGTIGPDGTLTVVFINNTRSTFLDFHFRSGTQQQIWTGSGLPFFGSVFPNNVATGIDFFTGGTGFGIGPTTTFCISFTNFQPGSIITAQATVPEPTTLLLLGTGVAGIAIKTRKRLRSRKSGDAR